MLYSMEHYLRFHHLGYLVGLKLFNLYREAHTISIIFPHIDLNVRLCPRCTDIETLIHVLRDCSFARHINLVLILIALTYL